MIKHHQNLALLLYALCLCSCGADRFDPTVEAEDGALEEAAVQQDCLTDGPSQPYASEVISFDAGSNAGFGRAEMPDIVLGPPAGKGTASGSLDVVSLGVGGEIVLGFGDRVLRDGDGVDLIVYENVFWGGGNPEAVWVEIAEVAVSSDLEQWHTFDCDLSQEQSWPGCAGWNPILSYDPCEVVPVNIESTGGDGFDFAELGVDHIRYVRIRDLASEGASPSAGFDLDAISGVHIENP